MEFQHLDVFADTPFTGNSVTVFLADSTVTTGQMLSITREFRHFESIFLWPTADDSRWRARVFDLADELDFAGHPVLGAAAALHDGAGGEMTRRWTIELPARTVTVQTTRDRTVFRATLDQGSPVYGPSGTGAAVAPVLDGIGLCDTDLVPGLEPAVVSTGLRYLVIPVRATALARRSPCTRAASSAGPARSRSNLAVRPAQWPGYSSAARSPWSRRGHCGTCRGDPVTIPRLRRHRRGPDGWSCCVPGTLPWLVIRGCRSVRSDLTAWMPLSCCCNDMTEASTPYVLVWAVPQ